MSNTPEPKFDLEDLELQLLPAWARQAPQPNRYAHFEGAAEGRSFRDRESRDRRPRPGGSPPRGPEGGRRFPPRREGGRGPEIRREERRETVVPLPELHVSLVPEERGVESLARQIKLAGRAYPMFEIAQLILRKPDRYHVTFSVTRKPDGRPAQPLWLCSLDDTIWLSEDEAVGHVLRRHLDTFYQADRTPTEPPKGTYTFVAQCSLSGVILGPPNFHDYQAKLHKLHASRFARMPLEAYKAKVKIVRDEAVVKKWIDEQSWRTDYVCLNLPEPLRLATREEVERHFREVHLANIIRPVETWTGSGEAAQKLPTPALRLLVRRAWEEQQRFPLRVVNVLSQQFAGHGLQFFKVNKSVTHVAVARPHHLDLDASPVSEGIRRIVEFIDATSNCTRKLLVQALVPKPAAPAVAPAAPIEAESAPAGAPSAAVVEAEPTPEQTALVADLHWLIHQGHVIEFANGKLETAKKPKPKPEKPPAPVMPAAAQAAPLTDSSSAVGVSVAVPENPASPEVVPPSAVQAEAPAASPEPAGETSASSSLASAEPAQPPSDPA
jgi:hypothetical protein